MVTVKNFFDLPFPDLRVVPAYRDIRPSRWIVQSNAITEIMI